jgi:hypothetical protein
MAFQGNHLGTLRGRGFALIKSPGRDPALNALREFPGHAPGVNGWAFWAS